MLVRFVHTLGLRAVGTPLGERIERTKEILERDVQTMADLVDLRREFLEDECFRFEPGLESLLTHEAVQAGPKLRRGRPPKNGGGARLSDPSGGMWAAAPRG